MHDDPRPDLDSDGQAPTAPLAPDTTPSAAMPSAIGPFRIIGLLGTGGMGVVYRAEQDHPRREVALKVVRAGLVTGTLLRRFQLEADILGRLQHPGIAQVYQVGLDGDSPFFAMELIDGAPLNGFARGRKLSVRERLELFAKICDAVEHAHQKGVIHRDLKPGNILIDSSGQPKVLDFGIARATDGDIQTTTIQTDIGQLIGTIPYMSPEQASGDPAGIDTRSDVYALGVILYELLAEKPPYDLSRKLVPEAIRIIQQDEPTRLSFIERTLRGDVETIVGKALEKTRERRYQSASAFSDDIRRYLNDEPISVRPPSATYQLSKFARRHRALVTGLTAVFLVLVAGMISTSLLAVGQSRARADAVEQRQLADKRAREADEARAKEAQRADELEQVAAFQSEQLGEIDPDGVGLTIRDSLREKIGAVADRRGLTKDERSTLLAEHDAIIAGVDFTGMALDTLDAHIFEPSIRAIQSQFQAQPPVEARLLQSLAIAMVEAGLLERAEAIQSRSLILRRELYGDQHVDTLSSIHNTGALLLKQGELDDAELRFMESLEGRRRALGDDHINTLESIGALGAVYFQQSKLDEAEAILIEAVERSRRALGDEHEETMKAMDSLSILLDRLGRRDEAERLCRETLELRRRALGDKHVDTIRSTGNLSYLLQNQGRHAEAEPYAAKTIAFYRASLGDDHPSTLIAINNMGTILLALGRLEDAEPYLQEALAGRRRVLGADHFDTLGSMNNLGDLLGKLERYEEAEQLIREAMIGFQRSLGDHHPFTLNTNQTMGELLRRQERLPEAVVYFRTALDGRRASLGDDHISTLTAMYNLCVMLLEIEEFEDAEALGSAMLAGAKRALGEGHAYVGIFGGLHAETLEALGRLDEAESAALAAYAVLTASMGPEHSRTQDVARQLAALYIARHEIEPDGGYGAKADTWREKFPPNGEGASE